MKKFAHKHKFCKKDFATVLLVVLSVAMLCVFLPLLPQKPTTAPPKHYQGVLQLWNVENFEGGSGNRHQWLVGKCANFEKQHTGLFVHVTTLSHEQALQKLNDGQSFDIVCFSRGTANAFLPRLVPFDGQTSHLNDNFVLASVVGGKQMAVPLYAGGYLLFARTSQVGHNYNVSNVFQHTYAKKVGKTQQNLKPLMGGFATFNSPISALYHNDVVGGMPFEQDFSQYQAYQQFVANNVAVSLLGTQRDLVRLLQRQENGKIPPLSILPLGGYTDLLQCVALGTSNQMATEFVEYLVSNEVQQTLCNVGLFAVTNQNWYTAETFCQLESLLKTAHVPNVFDDEQSIARQKQQAENAVFGGKQ